MYTHQVTNNPVFYKKFEFDGMKSSYRFYKVVSLLTVNKRENTNLLGQMVLKEKTD